MSAWGPALFSDDAACDVRDAYRELIEDGIDDAEATRRVLADLADMLDDPEDGPVVRLALAWTQSKLGRLDPQIRDRALRVIDEGEGLELWAEQGDKLLTRRRAALKKVRDQLTGPQPDRKRLRPPWRHVTDLEVGDVLTYRTSSGAEVRLQVVAVEDDRHGRAPILRQVVPEAREADHPTRVWVHRKKDSDYADLGFTRVLGTGGEGEEVEHTSDTQWAFLAGTLERHARAAERAAARSVRAHLVQDLGGE
ncbi:hypothetical protein [Nonomuraea sediminis]|uniref:hypothetical protein n=1 Tax=Nonomuraea sediminis TaxID=2835864 RepID=UPI001BDD24D3|nr:hypothetical protein [Nonomuraea sediminis]